MSPRSAVVLLSGVLVFAVALAAASCGRAERSDTPAVATGAPTFSRDIAPILWERCAPCHRPGEVAPFSLLTYADAAGRARDIARVTRRRYMPPWQPEPGYGEFAGERRLTDAQIDLIGRWVESGAPEGNPRDLPARPRWPEGWQLGQPDLVVTMPEPYEVPAEGHDIFRNFVIPVRLPAARYVKGVEFRPGNPRVVHHAVIQIARARQVTGPPGAHGPPSDGASDRHHGEGGMIALEGESPDGHFLGWAPGKVASMGPEDLAWRLEPGTDLVLQLHLMPRGTPMSVQSSIGLYFTDRAPARRPFGLQLGSYTIDVPAGATDHPVEDSYVLPVDVEVLSIFPHAHYLGKEMKAAATLPDGSVRWLFWIKDWDFNWQDQYWFARPVFLPRGSTLTMRYTYDNSEHNPQNPSRPPRRVRYGGQSSDEMGNLWIQVVPANEADLAVLRQDYERKATMRYVEGDLKKLQDDPDSPAIHRSLGASYLRLGRPAEALAHLQASLRRDPSDVHAHYNVAHAFAATGRLRDAAAHFREAARLDPLYAEAHNNLGVMLQGLGDLDGALARYGEAVRIDPGYAEAHNNLGVALQAQGRLDEAIRHFRRAVAIQPDYRVARQNLADALAEQGRR
jgi:tetratricopeptide (TPR) repeat protein